MQYKVGMYGGSFDPLHTGHIHDIIKAAAMCEELFVMISWCEGRESTSKELRYRWILNSIKHLPIITGSGELKILNLLSENQLMQYFVGVTIKELADLKVYILQNRKLFISIEKRFQSALRKYDDGHRNVGTIFQRFADHITQRRCWLLAEKVLGKVL